MIVFHWVIGFIVISGFACFTYLFIKHSKNLYAEINALKQYVDLEFLKLKSTISRIP